MGAGVLPVTIMKGTIFFLLGKERYNQNYWCDFGGSSTENESIYQTAIREGYEELDGFFGNQHELKKKVNKSLIKNCYTDRYTTFLFKVDYNELYYFEKYFNNHKNFINNELNLNKKEGFFEKSEVRLFTKKDIVKNINEIRPFYREIVYQLIDLSKDEIFNSIGNV